MPKQALWAVRLMWATLGLGLVNSLLQWNYLTSQASQSFVLSVQFVTLVIMVWLIYKLWRGRNWARITLLVLFAIGLLPSLPVLAATFRRDPIAGSIGTAVTILQVVAFYLVFATPGRLWFAKGKTAAMPA